MSYAPTIESQGPTPESPFIQKPVSLLDTAINLYGFLPADDDPRWSFLTRYEDVKQMVEFRAMNFDNAWRATYLSATTSFRSGYVTTVNPENSLQLNRALDNLSLAKAVTDRYSSSSNDYENFDMRFTVTDRLTTDPTKPSQDETPCPEALYQIRLYETGRYLARVGFNLHHEDSITVLSLVNIQGTPGSVSRNAIFEATHDVSPFNLLVQRVQKLAHTQSPEFEIRGIINPDKGNTNLYWGVLSHEGVEMYHAQRQNIQH